MPLSPNGPIGRMLHRRSVKRWQEMAKHAAHTDLATLHAQSESAQKLLRHVGAFQMAADRRLALQRTGGLAFPVPPGTDWSWRPKPWAARVPIAGLAPVLAKSAFTEDLVVFHDCPQSEITLRQCPNLRETDLNPFGICLEVFHFSGSYLSLVLEVPKESCAGLRKSHLMRFVATMERERPTKIYARLNVKNGPNTEQILMTLPEGNTEAMVEFDLAYSGLNESRAEKMWIDLMVEAPTMNKINFRDLTLCRYPRADI